MLKCVNCGRFFTSHDLTFETEWGSIYCEDCFDEYVRDHIMEKVWRDREEVARLFGFTVSEVR